MTRIYYDTEFLDTGREIELISIGLVSDDGPEYYAVASDAPWDEIAHHRWLCDNVVPYLPLAGEVRKLPFGSGSTFTIDLGHAAVKPRWVIANEVRQFILDIPHPELCAWYAAYDHVALAQLWGPMIKLPKGIPMFTCDLKQDHVRLGEPQLPRQTTTSHHALADAQWNRQVGRYLQELDRKGKTRG
ncbi:3'-5' exoribonuclease [Nonomuraea basaltis]|uniref:3'-5' exoribonuclease n=1 Tax=Nonomuraea basaltis TaxID=2495887 RepID=UPI00110C4B66|nr:3'-5' exoribonuclease [Nonomuraea basaltis]TMR91271.1 3'-5' exoribonuclease [Nonomuraea basaltis]